MHVQDATQLDNDRCVLCAVSASSRSASTVSVQVHEVRVRLPDGTHCSAARKRPIPGERYDSRCNLLEKEAHILSAMQDTARHPSGASCRYLPHLLAINTERHPGCKPEDDARQRVTEVLTTLGTQMTLQTVLQARRRERAIALHAAQERAPSTAPSTSQALMTDAQLWEMSLGIAEGLHHMHKGGWAHGDIKPSNVVISTSGAPLLIDFDSSQQLCHNVDCVVGTEFFIAPEVSRGGVSDKGITYSWRAADVFSLGNLMLSMVMPPGPEGSLSGYSKAQQERMRTHGLSAVFLKDEKNTKKRINFACSSSFLKVIRMATRPAASRRASLPCLIKRLRDGLSAAIRLPALPPPPPSQQPAVLPPPVPRAVATSLAPATKPDPGPAEPAPPTSSDPRPKTSQEPVQPKPQPISMATFWAEVGRAAPPLRCAVPEQPSQQSPGTPEVSPGSTPQSALVNTPAGCSTGTPITSPPQRWSVPRPPRHPLPPPAFCPSPGLHMPGVCPTPVFHPPQHVGPMAMMQPAPHFCPAPVFAPPPHFPPQPTLMSTHGPLLPPGMQFHPPHWQGRPQRPQRPQHGPVPMQQGMWAQPGVCMPPAAFQAVPAPWQVHAWQQQQAGPMLQHGVKQKTR